MPTALLIGYLLTAAVSLTAGVEALASAFPGLWAHRVTLSLVLLLFITLLTLRGLLDFLDQTDREHDDGQLAAVVVPEFVPAHWWQGLPHNQTAWLIKAALLYRRRRLGFQRVIIDIPYHLNR